MAVATTQEPTVGHPSPTVASLELALRAAHAGVWEWDLETDENRWTDEVWHLYGLDPGALPPSFDTWLSSVHPDDREQTLRVVSEARQVGAPFETSWRTNPERGPIRWILSRGQPGLIARNGPTHYVGIVMDITAHKLAEEEIQRLNAQLTERVADRTAALNEHQRLLQTILDGVPGLIGYWDDQLRNRFANYAYGEWFGIAPQDIHGRHIVELLGEDLYALNKPYIDATLRGERQCFLRDLPVPGQPGLHRVSETHYLPDFDGNEVKGFLVLVLDVTNVKRAEEAARAASQAKSDFLSNISHELRTPLNTMFGLAQIGQKESANSASAATFRQILASGQHLLSLIDDVLDFSKIEAGKMHLHLGMVDIGKLIEQVIGVTALRACGKGLKLVIDESVDAPAQVLSDAKRLAQILVNLTTNAIKFTDQGEVRLSLHQQGDRLHITVSDTGMGIPAERLGELFQPFVQVHDRSHDKLHDQARDAHGSQAGTGLGLAICKHLVSLMGGSIVVQSELGSGTSFSVTLPLKASTRARWTPLSNILLIGYQANECEQLLDQFKQRGCPACCRDTPPEALPAGAILLVHQRALSTHLMALLNERLAAGLPVIVHTPDARSRPTGPDGAPLSMDAILLSGPLSPLRLLNALSHRPRPRARNGLFRLKGLRILAAEDNPVNRLILGQMLEAEGAIIEFAFDGAQAVARVEQGKPDIDLILCDIQMPIMDGNEATRRIKVLAPHMPIIGLTAHAFSQAREEALRCGMVDYITKPYMLDTLVQAVLKHVTRPPETSMNVVPPSNSASLSAPPERPTPAADWASMQQHFAPQPGVLTALIGVARQTLPGVAEQLDLAVQASDLAQLAKVAHEIKGIALNLRTPGLTELATLTQDQARQADPTATEQGQRLSAHLRGFLAQLVSGPDQIAQASGRHVTDQ